MKTFKGVKMKRTIIALVVSLCTIFLGYAALENFSQTPSHPKTELILYNWQKIDILTVEPEIDALLARQNEWLQKRLNEGSPYTWENFVLPQNEMADELYQLWYPINHLSTVSKPEESVREKSDAIYERCQTKITQFELSNAQNEKMFNAYKEVRDTAEKNNLLPEQIASLDNTLRDYRLSGILLSAEKRQDLTKIIIELGTLTKKFSDNETASSNSWKKHITDEKILDGIPQSVINSAKEVAQKNGLNGYVLTLGDGTVGTIISYAKNRDLREEAYRAIYSVASANGPQGQKFDNAPVIEKILELRHKEAKLLGFNNYAEMALETRMAKSTAEVMNFITDLQSRSRPFAERDIKELSAFALSKDGLKKVEPWDVSYYQQLLKKEKFNFSEEAMRPYFPLSKVMGGLSSVVNKLYGVTIRERAGVSVWHKSVKFYEVYSSEGNLIGGFYLDLFQREGKNSGGWANSMVDRYQKSDGTIQLPVGLIVLNLQAPTAGEEPLLGFQEVLYLFHEFGHNSQKLLTKINTRDISGGGGVPWDGVELPSQFMENFVWQPEVIGSFAFHYKTGEKMPLALLETAREVRMFGKGLSASRATVLDEFDFRLHLEYVPGKSGQSDEMFSNVYRKNVVTTFYPWMSTYPNSFGHIFAGGYSAGYYSYHWAEVLAADDFSQFIKNGKIDWSVGKKFNDEILSVGGSRPFSESNEAFLGRKPSIDALMRQYGFISSSSL